MKTLTFLFITFLVLNSPDISTTRRLFIKAANSKSEAEKFSSTLTRISNGSSKTLLAYKAASIIIAGKFASRLEDKKKNAVEGITMLENTVAQDRDNVEIRLIRLSIQENSPRILKYKKNIAEDKTFIVLHYKDQPAALKDFIKAYTRQSKVFSEADLKSLN
jgi:hypothetical protein